MQQRNYEFDTMHNFDANFDTSKRPIFTFKAGKYKVPICILSFLFFSCWMAWKRLRSGK